MLKMETKFEFKDDGKLCMINSTEQEEHNFKDNMKVKQTTKAYLEFENKSECVEYINHVKEHYEKRIESMEKMRKEDQEKLDNIDKEIDKNKKSLNEVLNDLKVLEDEQ